MFKFGIILLCTALTTGNVLYAQLTIQGPNAPDLQATYENNTVTLTLSDDNPLSNNFQQGYLIDDGVSEGLWRFEGYIIYQAAWPLTDLNIDNLDHFRQVAQCDIENDASQLVNYRYDEELEICVPVLGVQGENEGIQFEFEVTHDLFALWDTDLVDSEIYCYLAVAYATNPNGVNPECDNQPFTFLRSNSSPTGGLMIQCTGSNVGVNIESVSSEDDRLWVSGKKLFLTSNHPSFGEVKVYSSDGRLVEVLPKLSEYSQEWNLEHLSPGIYVIHSESKSSITAVRFMIEQ